MGFCPRSILVFRSRRFGATFIGLAFVPGAAQRSECAARCRL